MTYITAFCILRNYEVVTAAGSRTYNATSLADFMNKLHEATDPSYAKFHKMDTLSKLGLLATDIMLKDYAIKVYAPESVSVVLSNANGSLNTDLRFQESTNTLASPSLFVYTLPNIVIGEICIRHGFKGENAFFITPHFDSQFLTDYVDQVFSQAHVNACITGWVEVLEEQYDVFVYVVERIQNGLAIEHTSEEVDKIYTR